MRPPSSTEFRRGDTGKKERRRGSARPRRDRVDGANTVVNDEDQAEISVDHRRRSQKSSSAENTTRKSSEINNGHTQMAEQEAALARGHRRKCEEPTSQPSSPPAEAAKGEPGSAPDASENPDFRSELRRLEENMAALERKQALLDSEEALLDKEENITKRSMRLQEFEKEVEEAETLLDRRQNIARRRSQTVEMLNHDLLTMKAELEERLDEAQAAGEDGEEGGTYPNDANSGEASDQGSNFTNSSEASSKARRHWQLARRHLVDKVSLLEATVQRYRTQVASASANITAKDMVIDKLKKQNLAFSEEMEEKTKRIKQLEMRLSLTLEDKTRCEKKLDMLLDELQNIDLNATAKMLSTPEKPAGNTPGKQIKKQSSSFSFFSHSPKHSRSTHSGGSTPKRALSDKHIRDTTCPTISVSLHEENTDVETDGKQKEDVNGDVSMDDSGIEYSASGETRAELTDENGSKACLIM
ncbi:S phase cyclin A-associated protein in the endoplasmic reticulum-like isoform X2 [Mya arenaria]|uniref:S phase cyclin A-associated protein in the endoplasmic reticulum-like isoform X2 n=1 Tax=Mya arenaria TaxID=6604 RepID=UPI0022E07DAC|nr:S phase cyclin A-associated protein in the endoplasmic reticulum-like isoform X2 [Mya arenaria]